MKHWKVFLLTSSRHLGLLRASTAVGISFLFALPVVFARPQGGGGAGPMKVNSVTEIRANTTQERQRAEFYDRDGKSLLEKGTVVIVPHSEPVTAPPPPDLAVTSPNSTELTRQRVCSVDAVLLGQIVSSRPLLNKSETFLFTDFYVDVTTWIRPTSGERTAVVSMLGGEVLLQGRPISSRAMPLLRTGTRYILFAKRIPKILPTSFTLVGTPTPVVSDRAAIDADQGVRLTSLDSQIKALQTAASSCSPGAQ